MRYQIHIEGLEVLAHIGVTNEERATAQRLLFHLTYWPVATAAALEDNIDRTVDYAAVCAETTRFVETRADKLIETLADALASRLLEVFSIEQITIELRKFILPEVDYVSVTLTRLRPTITDASRR